ncbi:MAG: DivIVA domain-containing protein [Nitrospirae bacterium]|nr:DivIVA domain-containing protein [Nitrospirota bacterium]
MRITPLDIQNKQFPVRFRGFDMQEVSDFLEMIREELEELIRENNWLKEQASRNEEQIREYGKLEVVLKDTLVSTQEMVREYKETARKEAELILKDAELKAENLIREAQEKAIKIHEDITDLKGIRRHYREELIRLLDNHRRMVEFDIRSEEDQGSEI